MSRRLSADGALRAAERALDAARPPAGAVEWDYDAYMEAFGRVQHERARCGRRLLCEECGVEEDDREENCECDVPLCKPCHEGRMEHGHRHVHDGVNGPIQCCRDCQREATDAARCEWCDALPGRCACDDPRCEWCSAPPGACRCSEHEHEACVVPSCFGAPGPDGVCLDHHRSVWSAFEGGA